MSTLHVLVPFFPFISPLLPLSLYRFCLGEHLRVGACSCVCVHASEVEKGSPYKRALGLLFFPGTVIRWLSQESGQAVSYFSGALFLLFHAQRQHDLTWHGAPSLASFETQRKGLEVFEKNGSNESALCSEIVALKKHRDSTREGTWRDAGSEQAKGEGRSLTFNLHTQVRMQMRPCPRVLI